MTVAADAREAVRDHPFLETALRAGVLNYTAAARFLDVGDEEAVAAALRRYADELDDHDPPDRRASVSMPALVDALGRLHTAGVAVEAAAAVDGTLAVVVGRRDGADAVRALESAL
ncbi:hypothetical protein BRC63_00815 [Halobacteriales archaeon QH_10_70_21]|nr:MAG: hypothetical protein BRC63_00815 [Halobacteriales archaeon QH_10_70_21]